MMQKWGSLKDYLQCLSKLSKTKPRVSRIKQREEGDVPTWITSS